MPQVLSPLMGAPVGPPLAGLEVLPLGNADEWMGGDGLCASNNPPAQVLKLFWDAEGSCCRVKASAILSNSLLGRDADAFVAD